MNNKRIAYKVFSSKNTSWLGVEIDAEEIESKLNELGNDNWDLVSAFDVNHGYGATKEVLFILKKHIE